MLSIREGVVLAVKLISYTIPILTFIMNSSMAMNLEDHLFSMEKELPMSVILKYTMDVALYYIGVGPVDLNIFQTFNDSKECYKAVTFMLMVVFNITNLVPTFIVIDMVLNETRSRFKDLMGKIKLENNHLDEVIQRWKMTCSALSIPFFLLFTALQVLVTLVCYACFTGR